MTSKEIEEISKKAKIISKLNIDEFLKMIREKALKWKRTLHGS